VRVADLDAGQRVARPNGDGIFGAPPLGMSTLRSAIRGVLRSKGLSLAATMCIGLGAAATMSVATLANAVLLREPPFPDAHRLVRVWLDEQGVDPRLMLSIPESREVRALPVFDRAIGTARVRAVAVTADGAERLRGEAVDAGYFELLDVHPAAGRLLDDRDHRAGAPEAIVLGYGLWQRAYGGSASAIGATFRTERAVYTIVGVAPRSFTGSVEDDMVEFWTPMQHHEPRTALRDRDVRQTWILARLAPGATHAAADAQAAALTRDWLAREPQRYRGRALRVEPLGESWRAGFRQGTSVLLGAAGVLLAVAALNVGCLLLARVLDRRREFAVRAALGAGRAVIVRQLVVEAMVMCAAGGLVGLLAGPWLLRVFLAAAPVALPAYLSVTPDLRVTAAAFAALTLAALAAGTAPALVGGDLGLANGMRLESRGAPAAPGERRWVTLLIASETALTLMLLVSGGLLLRSYGNLASLDLGYRRDGIVRLAVTLSRADAGPIESRNAVFERIRAAAASVPGVESVGLVSPTLPPWDPDRARVRFDGMDPRAEADGLPVGLHQIDDGLLPTLGIPLIAGRAFTRDERAPAAIVSRGLADRLGGVEAALGRTITFPSDRMAPVTGAFRVVGVAENVAYDGLREQDTNRVIRYGEGSDPRAGRWDVYVPLSLAPGMRVSIGAFSRGDAASLIDPIRRTIAQAAPTSAVHWTGTMADDVAVEYASTRFYGVLVAAFSSSAMLLTGAGLFALLWNASIRRTGEMGLRFALGASRRSVAMLLVRTCVTPVAYGAAAGVLSARWISDAVKALLYGVPSFDPVSFSLAVAMLAAVCLLAALIPAGRAARVDPAVALRGE
jgi:predicted permease